MIISCTNLQFAYNQKTKFSTFALKGVTLSILDGEFFGVIGHTGSGKSTFIQHLNALIPVQEGILEIGDFNLSNQKSAKRSKKEEKLKKSQLTNLRKRVGMVFQYPEYQLFAETVFEDVSFGIKNFIKDVSPEEIKIMVKNALEMVGLNYFEIKDKSPFELSGGQKRRVAIAGVLAVRPEVLILDEPCAGLDPKGKTELWALLHRLFKQAIKTIIVVSHDMNDVAENCSRIAVFDHGQIKATGTPKELFKDTTLIDECGLLVPITAYCANKLNENGIMIDTDYTVDDFCDKILQYKNNK